LCLPGWIRTYAKISFVSNALFTMARMIILTSKCTQLPSTPLFWLIRRQVSVPNAMRPNPDHLDSCVSLHSPLYKFIYMLYSIYKILLLVLDNISVNYTSFAPLLFLHACFYMFFF
jgi:hypothetical protein